MKYLLLLMLLASPATAATVATWSGAGPHACLGRCSQEWAVAQLSPAEREELEALMVQQPDPGLVIIEDGDVFSLMSYFKDGEPVAYRTMTVAALSSPETGVGWHLDGWSFVRLDACGNWAIVKHGERIPVLSYRPETPPSVSVWYPPSTPPVWNPPPWEPPVVCCTVIVPPPPPPPTPAPVPLPVPALLLGGALASFALLRRRK